MSKKPLISFVVPAYKKPEHVFRRCLESLMDKSVPKNTEIIVVFDGPDEVMESVAKEFPKVHSVVVEHGGAPKARNIGLGLAKGDYVWFVDSDCYLKPGHVKRMIEEFEATDADFVYSGYEGTEGAGEFASESFNPYVLTCANYISSMAPIKRDKAPRWDETLEAAQDWDYWLTAVENGCKGVFVEGSGFIADTPNSGISSVKWNNENRDKTIFAVRHKHDIPDREIGVFTAGYQDRAIKLAEILGADVMRPTGPTPSIYKVIFNLGYNYLSRFEGFGDDVIKIQYWVPGEIEGLKNARYATVMETIRIAKGVINYCNTDYEKNKLEELGITAEVVPLPLAQTDIEKVKHDLPEKFTVLVATDKAYSDLLKEMSVDLPHINFIYNAAKVSDFSAFLSFYQFAALDNAMLIAHVNGRHVISNVQAPYCGFVDPDQSWEKFKRELYDKLRDIKEKPFNQEAQDYYLTESSPVAFCRKIHALIAKPLEVIS
jgi:glycosyltransferase involved in cell wall biosynthesis